MDKDSSSVIEPHELMFAVRSVLKLAPSMISDTEVNKLFVTLDEDGSGDVSLPEFFQFLEHGPNVFRERKRVYRELGVDGPARAAPVDHRKGKMPVRDAKTRVVDYNLGDEQVVHRESTCRRARATGRTTSTTAAPTRSSTRSASPRCAAATRSAWACSRDDDAATCCCLRGRACRGPSARAPDSAKVENEACRAARDPEA